MHVRLPFWFRGTQPVLSLNTCRLDVPAARNVSFAHFSKEQVGQACRGVEICLGRRAVWADLWYGPCHVELWS
jgi:hypothetical protein